MSENKNKKPQLGVGKIFKQMPLLYFLVFLGLFYTFNALRTEAKKRSLIELRTEVKEMRWRAMSSEAEFMHASLKSQVKSKVVESGMIEGDENVYLLRTKKNETED